MVDATANANILDRPGAGEESRFVLVKTERDDLGRAGEGVLHAVAVVNVEIEVKDAVKLFTELEDAEDDVVDVAEARGLEPLAVVPAAQPVDDDVGASGGEEARGGEGAAGDGADEVPQPREDYAIVL